MPPLLSLLSIPEWLYKIPTSISMYFLALRSNRTAEYDMASLYLFSEIILVTRHVCSLLLAACVHHRAAHDLNPFLIITPFEYSTLSNIQYRYFSLSLTVLKYADRVACSFVSFCPKDTHQPRWLWASAREVDKIVAAPLVAFFLLSTISEDTTISSKPRQTYSLVFDLKIYDSIRMFSFCLFLQNRDLDDPCLSLLALSMWVNIIAPLRAFSYMIMFSENSNISSNLQSY